MRQHGYYHLVCFAYASKLVRELKRYATGVQCRNMLESKLFSELFLKAFTSGPSPR